MHNRGSDGMFFGIVSLRMLFIVDLKFVRILLNVGEIYILCI